LRSKYAAFRSDCRRGKGAQPIEGRGGGAAQRDAASKCLLHSLEGRSNNTTDYEGRRRKERIWRKRFARPPRASKKANDPEPDRDRGERRCLAGPEKKRSTLLLLKVRREISKRKRRLRKEGEDNLN